MNLIAPTRIRKKGIEDELLSRAIETKYWNNSKQHKISLIREAFLPTGFPDLVIVKWRKKFISTKYNFHFLNENHAKLLQFLFFWGSIEIEELSKKINFSPREINILVNDLIKNNFLIKTKKGLRLRALKEIFSVKDIIAVEAKIEKFEEALNQAERNFWFASESYILIPTSKIKNQILERARERGIGILYYSEAKNEIIQLLKSEKISLPQSYGSWIINTWVLKTINTSND